MDRAAWWATVHGVAKSGTRRSDFYKPPKDAHMQRGTEAVLGGHGSDVPNESQLQGVELTEPVAAALPGPLHRCPCSSLPRLPQHTLASPASTASGSSPPRLNSAC